MARAINKLTDAAIRNAQPGEKDYPLSDGDGLDILITTRADEHGGKYWRFHFRFAGKQDTLRLGVYPAVPLVEARRKKLEAKAKLAEGVNPREAGKQQKAVASGAALFETVGLDWLAQYRESFSPAYRKSLHTHLLKHLFPSLGKLAVDGIGEKDLAQVLQAIVDAGHTETAHRVLRTAKFIFRHAVKRGLAERNPAQNLVGTLPGTVGRNMPAITKPEEIGPLMLHIERYAGNFTTQCALRLSPLVLLRPGELRKLLWEQVDFDRAELRLPIEHMKRRQTVKNARRGEIAHIVPLSRQALSILQSLRPVTDATPFVFAGQSKTGCLCENTVNTALKKLGYAGVMTAHGFRHMSSTNLHELGYPSHIIEKQIAHADRNRIRAVYNHAEYLPERRTMMQEWADWLDARREEARRREACGGLSGGVR